MIKLTITNSVSFERVTVTLPVDAKITVEHKTVTYLGMDGKSFQKWVVRCNDKVNIEYIAN